MAPAAEPTLLMNITDMIDLSIGSPECGNVDFNMLHTVLHCIVQQIRIRDKPVELRGDIANVAVGDMHNMKTVSINEFVIGTGNEESEDYDTLLVVERLWKLDAEETKYSPLNPKKDANGRASSKTGKKKKHEKPSERLINLYEENKDASGFARNSVSLGEEGVGGALLKSEKNTKYEIPEEQKEYSERQKVSEEVPAKSRTTEESVKQEKNIKEKAATRETTQEKQTEPVSAKTNDKTLEIRAIAEKISSDEIKSEKTSAEKILSKQIAEQAKLKVKTTNETDKAETEEKYTGDRDIEQKNQYMRPIISESMIKKEKNRKILTQKSNEKLSLVTKSKFEELEAIVKDLHERVYGCLPDNEDIIREVRSQVNLKSITDMWTSLNVSSRLKATEQAIQKLGSILQDVIGESGREMDELKTAVTDALLVVNKSSVLSQYHEDNSAFKTELKEIEAQQRNPQPYFHEDVSGNKSEVKEIEAQQRIPQPYVHQDISGFKTEVTEIEAQQRVPQPYFNENPSGYKTEVKEIEAQQRISQTHFKGDHSGYKTAVKENEAKQSNKKALDDLKEIDALTEGSLPKVLSAIPMSVTAELQSLQRAIFDLRREFDLLAYDFYSEESDKSAPKDVKDEKEAAPDSRVVSKPKLGHRPPRPKKSESKSDIYKSGFASDMNVALHRIIVKVNELDTRIRVCCDGLNKDNGQINDKIVNLQDQMDGFTKHLIEVAQSVTKYPHNVIKSLEGMMEIGKTVQDVEKQLHEVHETAQNLAAEKETRQLQIDALVEQIEVLKHVKMDREDIKIAMEEKADVAYCARKVNFNDFEQACEDLTKGLDIAFDKLKLQESIWQNALDDIQREIDAKLDKQELMPVKEFFNTKLLSLQVNLKKMAELRREAEAAGTRKRILRDVNCISCDAKVIMSMDPPDPPAPRPAPCTLSMKPYLSYELDTIRKTQKCIIPQRNMRDWEQIDKQMSRPPQKVRSETDKHICNRYCGGNHTVTTPAQRVSRTGHFVAQWGPDVVPLSAKMAAGDDGRMYKVNVTESSQAGPDEMKGEKSRRKESGRYEGDRQTAVRTSFAECHCLGSSSVRSEKETEKSLPRQFLSKAHGAK